jgi:hypothetical protein
MPLAIAGLALLVGGVAGLQFRTMIAALQSVWLAFAIL